VAVSIELITAGCNQFTQVFPLHFLAFTVEIKPGILNRIRLQTLNNFIHFSADPELAALLVYQIDKVLFIVLAICLHEMLAACLIALLEVRIDDH